MKSEFFKIRDMHYTIWYHENYPNMCVYRNIFLHPYMKSKIKKLIFILEENN